MAADLLGAAWTMLPIGRLAAVVDQIAAAGADFKRSRYWSKGDGRASG